MDSKGPSLYVQPDPSSDINRSVEEDSLVDGPLISTDALQSAIRREFHTLPTSWQAGLLTLLHIVYFVLSVCVAALCMLKLGQEEVCMNIFSGVSSGRVIVFGKVCLWVLVLVFDGCVQRHHNKVRSRGYLRFYRQTQTLKHVPLTIHSAGNSLLLILVATNMSQPVSTYLLLCILGLEVMVGVPCLFYYSVKVTRFNRNRAAPDVSQEEFSHTYSVTSLPTETGFRGASSLEEVVEKQADLIEYLKQHNTLLSKRLLNLTAQH